MSFESSVPSDNTILPTHAICLVFGVLSNEDTKIVISKPERAIGKMKGKRGLPLHTLVGQEYNHWYEYKYHEKRWEKIDYFPYANREHDNEDESSNTGIDIFNGEVTNADIVDDNTAQQLTSDEIIRMRDEKNSTELIQTIIQNSKTFDKKTQFSKEKYMMKKKQKYDMFAFVTRPTMDIIARSYFGKKAHKISYIRWDSLAQMLHNSGIKQGSNVMVLSTCHGLIPAALYDRFQSSIRIFRFFPDGRGVHADFNCIKLLHNFKTYKYNPLEDPFMTSGAYTAYVKGGAQSTSTENGTNDENDVNVMKDTNEANDTSDGNQANTKSPYPKFDFAQCIDKESILHFPMGYFDPSLKHKHFNNPYYPPLIQTFEENNMDCMIIATDQYDIEKWFKTMYGKLMKGGNFVVFSRFLKPLENLFRKMRECAVCVELFETWWRDYQVLKNRTHPKMVMNNASGYVFHGIKVEEWK